MFYAFIYYGLQGEDTSSLFRSEGNLPFNCILTLSIMVMKGLKG